MERIILFQKIAPHYRIPLFRELHKVLGICVCHSAEKKKASLKDCSDFMDYPHEQIRRFYLLPNSNTLVLQDILTPLLKHRPRVVICQASFGYLTMWALILLKSLFCYKLIAWSHGVRNDEILSPFSSFKTRILLRVFDHLDGVIFYSKKRKAIVGRYLRKNRNLVVARNTIDTHPLLAIYEKLEIEGKEKIKRELGIKHDFNIVFIGRLIRGKRIDILFDCFNFVSKKINVGLHIVGDGPEKYRVMRQIRNKPNDIYYHGAVYDDILKGKILYISDLTLNPGYVGLSIVESFCYATPVMTLRTSKIGPFHSPEIEYLVDNYNGILSNEYSIEENLKECLSDSLLLKTLSENALETAKTISLQGMVSQFVQVLSNLNSVNLPKKQ